MNPIFFVTFQGFFVTFQGYISKVKNFFRKAKGRCMQRLTFVGVGCGFRRLLRGRDGGCCEGDIGEEKKKFGLLGTVMLIVPASEKDRDCR